MTVQILTRRSILSSDRPFPSRLGVGELALNANASDPGLYFADSTQATLIKAGPISVGSTAPNSSPVGYTSLTKGESWLDTTSTQILKIYDGTAWQTAKAVATISSGKPSNPVDGQLHYDLALTKLYIYRAATTSWLAT